MSLKDGLKKMSKSEEIKDWSSIADDIVKKIKKAKSDSSPIPDNTKELESKPEALNLINIYAELTNSSSEKVLDKMKGKDYSFLKKKLSEILVEVVCPLGKKIKKLI